MFIFVGTVRAAFLLKKVLVLMVLDLLLKMVQFQNLLVYLLSTRLVWCPIRAWKCAELVCRRLKPLELEPCAKHFRILICILLSLMTQGLFLIIDTRARICLENGLVLWRVWNGSVYLF